MKLELSTPSERGTRFTLDLLNEPWKTEGISAFLLGNKGAGKSHALAIVAEQSHKNRLPFIFYDKNGDACSLRELGDDVVVLGNTRHHQPERKAHYSLESTMGNMGQYIKRAVKDGFSLVIDLSAIEDIDARPLYLAQMLNMHHSIAGMFRHPTMVIIDEAHEFAPQYQATSAQKDSLKAMKLMMSDGRKRGIYSISATQQITEINKRFIALMNLRFFGKITHHAHFKYIEGYLPYKPGTIRKVSAIDMEKLNRTFLMCMSDGQRHYTRMKFRERKTTDLGGTPVAVPRTGPRPNIQQLDMFNSFNVASVKNGYETE